MYPYEARHPQLRVVVDAMASAGECRTLAGASIVAMQRVESNSGAPPKTLCLNVCCWRGAQAEEEHQENKLVVFLRGDPAPGETLLVASDSTVLHQWLHPACEPVIRTVCARVIRRCTPSRPGAHPHVTRASPPPGGGGGPLDRE